MHLIKKILLVLAVAGFTSASATPATTAPVADFTTLATPQPAETGTKVEVIEFFSYACPHCKAFDPALEAWVKKNSDKVAFRRVHVAFNPAEKALQRMYLALEAMKMTEALHHKAFVAVHEEKQRLYSDQAVIEWVARNGIDRDKFLSYYNAFDIQARLARTESTIAAYQIDHWPAIGVAGRYLTSPSQVARAAAPVLIAADAQHAGGLAVMDRLVAKASAEAGKK